MSAQEAMDGASEDGVSSLSDPQSTPHTPRWGEVIRAVSFLKLGRAPVDTSVKNR
jgi:hypothetical protein